MTPPKSNKRFFTPSNFGFFIEIFCKVSASREKNEVYFNFSEAPPVLCKSKTNKVEIIFIRDSLFSFINNPSFVIFVKTS